MKKTGTILWPYPPTYTTNAAFTALNQQKPRKLQKHIRDSHDRAVKPVRSKPNTCTAKTRDIIWMKSCIETEIGKNSI